MSGLVDGFFGCSWEGEWPDRLRRGVRRVLKTAGVSREEWLDRGFDVHHVVAASLDGAKPGRRVLARWSVNVHNIVNAAIIPRSFHQGQGLHRAAFLRVVNERLSAADELAISVLPRVGYSSARLILVKTVQKIGTELVIRSGDVLAFRLQAALQDRASPFVSANIDIEPWRRKRMAGESGAAECEARNGPAVGADLNDEVVRASR